MKFIDLFAGIGGAALGLEKAGLQCVAHSEIEDYPRRILRQHWPAVKLFGDIKEIHDLPEHDVISAGVPCQGNSLAGQRKGTEDARWLWPEVRRLVARHQPKYLLVENPPGLLSVNKGEAFAQILGDLDELGYVVEWTVFSAARLGARHLRKRVWIVAYPVSSILWEQPGRGSGPDGTSAAFAPVNGAEGFDADGNGNGNGGRGGLAGSHPGVRDGARGDAAPDAERGGPQGPQGIRPGESSSGPGRENAPDSARQSEREPPNASDSLSVGRDPRNEPGSGHPRGTASHGILPRLGRGQGFGRDPCPELPPAERGGPRPVFGDHARGLIDAAWPGAWGPECRLGGTIHGLPVGAQPADDGGDSECGAWECGVPRVRQNQPHWEARIKALGNAAVPQCAEIVGRLIMAHFHALR